MIHAQVHAVILGSCMHAYTHAHAHIVYIHMYVQTPNKTKFIQKERKRKGGNPF